MWSAHVKRYGTDLRSCLLRFPLAVARFDTGVKRSTGVKIHATHGSFAEHLCLATFRYELLGGSICFVKRTRSGMTDDRLGRVR